MPDKLPVYGFGGSSPSSPSAISATLSTMLPDTAFFFLPEISRGKKNDAGLRVVRSWISTEYDEGDCKSVPDVVEVLAKHAADGHPVTLVLLYDNDAEADQQLRWRAAERGIEVRDLAQGMMVMVEPEPSESPAPPLPADGLSADETDQLGAPEPLMAAVPPLPADEVATRRLAVIGEDDPDQELAFALGMTILRFVRSILRRERASEEDDMTGLVPGVNKPLQVVREAAQAEPAAPAAAPEPETRTKYIRNEETDQYRKRKRGKVPGGWVEIMLTDHEIAELKLAGKVLEA